MVLMHRVSLAVTCHVVGTGDFGTGIVWQGMEMLGEYMGHKPISQEGIGTNWRTPLCWRKGELQMFQLLTHCAFK